MDARLQRRVQRYGWDRAAGSYERAWSDQLAPAQQRLLALAGLTADERVLDVACGTGLVTFPAADAVGAGGLAVATDLSGVMVASVATTAAARGLSHVRSARMDAESLEFPDQSFDVVLCALGLMYVADPSTALREMHRVLRPGGRAVAAVWGARDKCGWAEIFPIIERRVASEVCPMFFQLGTGDALLRVMDDVRFTAVDVERLSTVLHYGTGDDACAAAFEGGPVALAYSRFDGPTRDEAQAEYLQSISFWRYGSGYDVPGEFVVARGIRAPE